MQPNDQREKRMTQRLGGVGDAENPVSQASGPGGTKDQEAIKQHAGVGINPQNTGSMSRAEDDETAFEHSPEFSDRPGQGTKAGQRAGGDRPEGERREDRSAPDYRIGGTKSGPLTETGQTNDPREHGVGSKAQKPKGSDTA